MRKFESLNELNYVVYGQWKQLDDINEEYLSEAGLAKKEALKAVIWHMAFCETLEDLYTNEEFMDLVNIGGKHPEFYKVLRTVIHSLEYSVEGDS